MAKKKKKELIDIFGYICKDCAKVLGGVWPKGHVATFHINECDCCGRKTSLASVGDWNWPDGMKRGMRD